MTKVAIIGCGISGITAAVSCLEQNLDITVFERRSNPGGIWSMQSTPVFDNLTTNTAVFEMFMSRYEPSRITRANPENPNQDLCFSKQEMSDYFCSVVEQTGLERFILFEAVVTNVDVDPDSSTRQFIVRYNHQERKDLEDTFDHVVVATGHFDNPWKPSPSQLPGLSTFKSQQMHVSSYNNPSQLQGKKVLMVGGSHSALEAVADMLSAPDGTGPSSVTVSTRIMRQIIAKQRNGRVLCTDYSSRYALLRILAGRLTPEQLVHEQSMYFVDHKTVNAPPPTVPFIIPPFLGFTVVNANLVDAVQKGRSLKWNVGGIERVTENGVVFADGTSEEFDAIVLTGYQTRVPCLSEEMQKLITPEDGANVLELYDYTFHPDLPGISFVGLFPPGTASVPIFENQARWVAATISGQVKMVDKETMRKGIERNKLERRQGRSIELTLGFTVLDTFAKHGGFEVDLGAYPELSKAMLFGPLCPAQFRMFGNGSSEIAKDMFEKQIEAGGCSVGDTSVDKGVLEEMKVVTDTLEDMGAAPKGLRNVLNHLSCVAS